MKTNEKVPKWKNDKHWVIINNQLSHIPCQIIIWSKCLMITIQTINDGQVIIHFAGAMTRGETYSRWMEKKQNKMALIVSNGTFVS